MALSSSGSSNNAIQEAICLVDGCAADLRGCRKYYQRHKVCEAHSKSPQVSINGQKLRFCQQCSRFHSLEEFDEGKRSCRKRLDGRNRRRRKPRPYLFSPHNGASMLQPVGPPAHHPTMAHVSPLWSGVVDAPPWVSHSNYAHAPSLLSYSNSLLQSSCTTMNHVMHPPQSASGSGSVTRSPMGQRLSYGGLENDICDMGWDGHGMTEMDPPPPPPPPPPHHHHHHNHASLDHEGPQTFPYYLQW